MGGRHGPEGRQRTGARHRVGGRTDGEEATRRRLKRRGTRRRKPERWPGRGPRAANAEAQGTLQRRLSRAQGRPPGRTRGSHRPGPPSTRAVPWHPGTPTRPPGRALATSRGPGPDHRATVATRPSTERSPARTTADALQPRVPLDRTGARSSSSRGTESTSPGDDRPLLPRPIEGQGGDDTQQRRGRFRSRGGRSRDTQHAFSHPVEAGAGGWGWVGGDGEGGAQRATAGSAWGWGRLGRKGTHQRRREPGHQVNVRGIPPPPARERSRDARGRRPASAPLASLPHEPGPAPTRRWGPIPREPPAAGEPPSETSIRPSGPSRSHGPGGEAPPKARAARPVPTPPPPAATRDGKRVADSRSHGTGRGGAAGRTPTPPPWETHAGREQPHAHSHARRSPAHRTPARPGGILPRLGGGRRRPR